MCSTLEIDKSRTWPLLSDDHWKKVRLPLCVNIINLYSIALRHSRSNLGISKWNKKKRFFFFTRWRNRRRDLEVPIDSTGSECITKKVSCKRSWFFPLFSSFRRRFWFLLEKTRGWDSLEMPLWSFESRRWLCDWKRNLVKKLGRPLWPNETFVKNTDLKVYFV